MPGSPALPILGQFRFERLPKFLQQVGFFNVGPGAEGLDLTDPFGFRVPARDDHLLAGANLHDLAIGFQTVHPRNHDHIE